MGNTVGTPTAAAAGGESHLSEEEAERLFREKIGYISIIKNRRIRSTKSQQDDIPGDLVSSLKDVSYSWGTSVTSEVTTPSAVNRSRISNDPGYSKVNGRRSQQPPPGRMRASTASTVSPTQSYAFSIASKDVSLATTCTESHVPSAVKQQPSHQNSEASKVNTSMQSRKSRLSANYPTKVQCRTLSASQASDKPQSISKKVTIPPQPMTEALLKEIQAKMIKGELELDSNGKEILIIKEEMEKLWTETQHKLEEREKTIADNEATISNMKKEMEQLKSQHKDASDAAHAETTSLLRKVTTLQNHLKIVEQERDAALAACENNDTGSSKATPKEEELKETIQELLNQLEDCEIEHQKEQATLRDDVSLFRKRLERLEGEYIALERERDDAVEKLNATEQKLRLEKAMANADIKQYQDELGMWKERYNQELRFTNKNVENSMQKTAVVLGSKLSAGILEGIQEDEELVMTSDDNGITTARLEDDQNSGYDQNSTYEHNSTYQRLMTRLRAVASPVPMTDVTANSVNSQPSYMTRSSSHSNSNYGWVSAAETDSTMEGKSHQASRNSGGGFDEAISIPSFLSQVW